MMDSAKHFVVKNERGEISLYEREKLTNQFFDNRNNREGGRLNFGEKQIEEKIKIIEKKII